jgi:general secretion pathway protein E
MDDRMGALRLITMPEKLYSLYQVADLLGATPATVTEWMRKGWLPFMRLPDGPIRISEDVLMHFLDQRGVDIEAVLSKTRRSERWSDGEPGEPALAEAADERDTGSFFEDLHREIQQDGTLESQFARVEDDGEPASPELPAGPVEPEGVDGPGRVESDSIGRYERAEPSDVAGQRRQDALPSMPELEREIRQAIGQFPPSSEPGEDGAPGHAPGPWVEESVQASVDPLPAPGTDWPVPTETRPLADRPGPAKRSARGEASPPAADHERVEQIDGDAPAEQIAGPEAAERPVDRLLGDALDAGASHVHIEPSDGGMSVRFRVGGHLRDRSQSPPRPGEELTGQVVAGLHELAGLEEGPSPVPTWGGFEFQRGGRSVRCRVTAFPTWAGEKITLRLSDPSGRPSGEDLWLLGDDLEQVRRLIERREGLVLFAAPARHGREETLRSVVGELDSSARSVVSLERRIERELPGVAQTRLDDACGMTACNALRALEDADADVVMLDRAADAATVDAALALAMSGRLVLAGVPASNGPEALSILADVNIDAWPMSVGLRGVVAQRAVRRLCGRCRREVRPDRGELARLGLGPGDMPRRAFAPQGCEACSQSGYAGMGYLASVLTVTPALARLIRHRASEAALSRAALAEGMRPVALSAARAVGEGLTSIAEVVAALR